VIRCEMARKPLNPIDKHVGSRVRMRRMMLGMSQEKLGDALGLTAMIIDGNSFQTCPTLYSLAPR
jgi:transcriptional regulator with XRE-family HTH domain